MSDLKLRDVRKSFGAVNVIKGVDFDVDGLVSRYGGDMELPEISRRARCGACGRKGGSVQVMAIKG